MERINTVGSGAISEPMFYCSVNHTPLSFYGIPDGRCIRAIWVCCCNFLYPERFYGQLSALEYTMEEIDGKCYLAANLPWAGSGGCRAFFEKPETVRRF